MDLKIFNPNPQMDQVVEEHSLRGLLSGRVRDTMSNLLKGLQHSNRLKHIANSITL